MKIACFGEAMIELTMQGDSAAVGVAGDTLNAAVYLHRTAPQIEVSYVMRLGSDAFSDRIKGFIAGQGLRTDQIEVEDGTMPGLYAITTDDAGERSFSYWRSAAAARRVFQGPDGLDFRVLDGFDAILLSGISLAILPHDTREGLITWLHDFRTRGGRVIYDSNHRSALWSDAGVAANVNRQMWALCDIALPSIDDEMAITGETADQVADRFVSMRKTGALKRGAAGPLCLETGQATSFPPAEKVVDTTAAGDSFNGGYLGVLLSGKPQADALRAGHELASRVVGHRGAILPL